MKYLYITFIIAGCMFTATMATAQNEQRHELSIYGLDGYSPLLYTLPKDGATKDGAKNGGAGLGYTFNINPSLGIVTGVEISTYTSEALFDNISKEYSVMDIEEFRFSYSLNNYRETQSLTLFSIPLMAQYSLPLDGGSTRFYASGGFKFGFPVSAKADIAPRTATTSGTPVYENVDYDQLPQHGFGADISLPSTKKDIDLSFSAALSVETGVRFALTGKTGLYTGMYFDYGLNNIQKGNNKHPLEYDVVHLSEKEEFNDRPFLYHSILNTYLVDKVKLMSIGFKLRVSFVL